MKQNIVRQVSRISKLSLGCAGIFLGISTIAQGADFNFQTLNNPADPTFNQLLGINNAGTISGYFGDGAVNPNKGYTLAPPHGTANYTNENFPGAIQTQVVGINNSGLTVGFWADALPGVNNFGFVDNSGTFTTVQDPSTPAAGAKVNQLLGVNDHNVAAGFYLDAAGNAHGYLYNIGTKSFVPITLPGSLGATSVTATDINNNGVVSGFYSGAGGNIFGFVDNNGHFTSFEAPGSSNTMFFGLNNKDQVVGSFVDAAGNNEGILYNFDNGKWEAVNDPKAVAANGGTILNGINDNDQLVGFYVDAAGNTDGMLVATPEPASAGLMVLGGLAAISFAWRRRKV